MTMKRCAYFGCMTPMFEPTDVRQKYCCHEHAVAASRSKPENRKKMQKYAENARKDPKRKYEDRRANYKYIANTGKLPDWMKS